ncbi:MULTISPECIES: acyl-CoA dehydrogenase [Xanthomonas]|uniref:Acyl-coenzyme A dehydrogenase n=1 Tax=Xanthomonas sacchari TaxID=56458 RepID=A0ABT3DVU2_9XANT|nr:MULTISPECIES: acyl-CoA dehydrogenase [Xanthomonas]KAB7771610.1 acyl-CoA dehydrogenase [Xanthomonas sp. LMG 12461]KAB7777660.1 acyl-CoA dehydrogenase [Xanthomonas sp. LMG 12459]MCW0369326.1 Acyl-coenzyme A dehydrogenase [Xanthomonas sacchari]MCW0373787.1 Acyl-coenzyme A dehydrogenase [Xanthomonas sacchari]MCW0379028.1 Acyl-coenzyme A dehydrogenase [Xanthomonas sacchari]
MSIIAPFLVLLLAGAFAAYHRMRLAVWAALSATLLVACWLLGANHVATIVAAVVLAVVAMPLLLPFVRKPLLTAPMLKVFRKVLPPLSQTERIALETGSVGFEGELFTGDPDWQKLLNYPKPQLTAEEQAFLDGPVEELCRMTNDWEITHVHADLPPEIWSFIKKNKFFGMIIPKEYGGLGFSALAHHKVIQKIASVSSVVSSTVGVPNSLGPGELLLHYGSKEQKDYYLPRLAVGQEVPCFGLTGPFAGSDATSIPDYGIVCKGEWNGANVLGVKLTFDKRYITLAPVATLVGLAFRMYDPEGLIGDTKDIGITLALLPRETPGVEIGRRHFPLNSPFQNGPIHGREVFIPLSQLIGGVEMVGKGWNMLNECLAVGRSITLPSTASGGAKFGAVVTGAYARIRKQFGLSVGRFEGVEEALARIGGKAYAISALSQATAAAVDRGDVPSVPSAIAKYHCTTMSREVISDVMDVVGGKGIILGPRNFAGRSWQAAPIAITVEGANIMTRSLLIFGQGAILCHPWVMKEMKAAGNPDHKAGVDEFDRNLFGHIGFAISNAVRSLWFGLTAARIGAAPGDAYTRRYFRKLDRYSANLALMADVSMLMLGGKLKFKESLSGRLGDVLSHIYMTSAMLKRYHDDGAPATDQPLLAWAFHDSVHKIELALSAALRNFPIRPVGWLMWALIFPWGRRAEAPGDRLGHRVAALLMTPNEARDRLGQGVFLTPCENNPGGRIASYLTKAVLAEPVERKFLKALKSKGIESLDFASQLDEAVRQGVLSADERRQLEELREITMDTISVDDFDTDELRSASYYQRAAAAADDGHSREAA